MSDLLQVQRTGSIETWTLNRPQKRNALDQAMVDALHARLQVAEQDQSLDCVVLTGAGDKAFVAGADIAQLRERKAADALVAINASLFDRLARLHCPTIAAVKGFALGGGCELAMACDLRIAADNARFGQPEVKLGIMAAAGGTYRLPALVGLGMLRELLFTGRIVDAHEALRIGLVNRVVRSDELIGVALEIAQEISEASSIAVRRTKESLSRLRPGGPEAIAAESAIQADLFESQDKYDRMDAFLQARRQRAARRAASQEKS
ncbi:MAG TPA: enoyl-CoA hydratase [Myxococcales bacterium]|nr:enoyl-CoA hydratase [Myxococcales bacterium]